MTEFERMQAFSYLDGAADGLKEARNDVIEELEHLKAVIRFNGLYNERIEDLIDIEIAGWKEKQNEIDK